MDAITSIKVKIDTANSFSKLKELQQAISNTEKELKKLISTKDYDVKKSKEFQDSIKKNQLELTKTRKEFDYSKLSLNELTAVRRSLQSEMKKTLPDSDNFKNLEKDLRRVNSTYEQLNNRVKSTQVSFGSFYKIVRENIQVGTAAFFALKGLYGKMEQLTDGAVKLSDTFADVRKTTGLTKDEIVVLDQELRNLDTRTSRENLLELARDAGKLGITGTENILQFVKAADVINVALGEDLGEGAIRHIGKMADVFGLTKELGIEQAYMKIGSAINDLGQSSTASEAYLVDFTQRLSGVGSQAGISIQDILGYGSALDQGAQSVEMSATALQKFIMKLFEEPQKFAKFAGKSVSEFTNLLETDANQAIKTVLQTMSAQGGFAQLVPVFQEMGLDGARAVGVLTNLASNIEAVNIAQNTSNESFLQGTSAMNEFSVKNETAAAKLEKHKNDMKELRDELGERLLPVLMSVNSVFMGLMKTLSVMTLFIANNIGKIGMLTAAWGFYYIAVHRVVIISKIKIALTLQYSKALSSNMAIMKLYAVVIALVQGSLTGAKVAMQAFTLAIRNNPIGAILTVITLVISAFSLFSSKAKEASSEVGDAYNAISDVSERAKKNSAAERVELDLLFQKLKQTNPKSQERLDLINKINSTYGASLKNLSDEKDFLSQINSTYDKLLQNINKKAKIQAREGALTDLYTQRDSLEIEQSKEAKNIENKRIAKQYKMGSNPSQTSIDNFLKKEKENLFKASEKSEEEFNKIWQHMRISTTSQFSQIKQVDSQINELLKLDMGDVLPAPVTPAPSEEKYKSLDYAKIYEKQIEDFKNNSRKLELEIMTANERELALISDKYNKEIKEIDTRQKEMAQKAKEYATLSKEGKISKSDYSTFIKEKSDFDEKTPLIKEQLGFQREQEFSKKKLEFENEVQNRIYELRKSYQLLTDFDVYDHDIKELEKKYQKQLLSTMEYELQKKKIQETFSDKPIEGAQAKKKQDFFDKYNKKGEDLDSKKQAEFSVLDNDAKLAGIENYEEQKRNIEEKYRKLKEAADQEAFESFLKKSQEAIQAFQNFSGNISGIATNLKEKDTIEAEAVYEKEKSSYDTLLKNKQISQKTYDKKMSDLEEEKAEGQKAIQKKYANMEFALKVSQIISSTALAALQAYASMAAIPVVGPALGAAAAAATAAFGATQIAVAKAEQKKAKGYQVGGYTGEGQADEPAGIVHKGEYVIPKWQMKERRTINYVQALEAIRTNRGYQKGGPVATKLLNEKVASSTMMSTDLMEITTIVKEISSKLNGVDIFFLKKQIDNLEKQQVEMQNRFGIR